MSFRLRDPNFFHTKFDNANFGVVRGLTPGPHMPKWSLAALWFGQGEA